jgi:hypothetical protein
MIWTSYTNYAHADLFTQQTIVRAEQNLSNLIQIFILRLQDINMIFLVMYKQLNLSVKIPLQLVLCERYLGICGALSL